jgi:hypothetical protein
MNSMTDRSGIEKIPWAASLVACTMLCFSCAAPPPPRSTAATGATESAYGLKADQLDQWLTSLPSRPPEGRRVVAICSFTNKTKRGAQALLNEAPGMLKSDLLRARRYRIIAWDDLEKTLQHHTLLISDIFDLSREGSAARDEIRKTLLNDFYLSGEVVLLGNREFLQETAFSARKRITAYCEVELFLRDAYSGEIIEGATGRAEIEEIFEQRNGVGGAADFTNQMETQALRLAIKDSVTRLLGRNP